MMAFTHLKDPAAAAEEMTGVATSDPATLHTVALGMDVALRKTVMGLHMAGYCGLLTWVQFNFPAKGAITEADQIPQVMYIMFAISFVGIMLAADPGPDPADAAPAKNSKGKKGK